MKSEFTKRTSMFPVKMTPEEIKELKEIANHLGMSAGAYLRFLYIKERDSKKVDFGITKNE